MELTSADKKRIGKNIKAIRKAIGKSTDEFADILYISKPQLEHIENGSYQISDETIAMIANISTLSVNDIKYGDLSFLEKNSLNFGENISASEFFDDDETIAFFLERYQTLFPIENTNKKSEYFEQAMTIYNEKIMAVECTEEELDKLFILFERAYKEEEIEAAYVNALSSLGTYYCMFVKAPIEDFEIKDIEEFESDNYVEIIKQIKEKMPTDKIEQRKNAFLDKYNDIINKYLNTLNKSGTYKDYVYYFLAIRYQIAMLRNSIANMSDLEMTNFSESLLDSLYSVGNKYAVNLHNFVEKNKEENL